MIGNHHPHAGLDLTTEQLNAALDKWKADCDNRFIAAAVTLVQEHDGWLHRTDFRRSCIYVWSDAYPDSAGKASIHWRNALDFLEGNPNASTSELSVLRFACALALDEFSWSALGSAHLDMVWQAFATAMKKETNR
ncbi:hypothetical protein HFP15_40035 [Amycolatopsis sp. K13G38]|uniref:Uncharacterized protein n=1 Tax=Amycolatopsis acididurans TaxID=2724524 RepID=A0ABX1JII7_9PSEU|nr:hypothetical protein [Amycolatopsis acididurans]NKQ59051.1 hypothetical protein [Amycolatopsis acididurans]